MRALNITYPIENGVITRWDDMEELWKYTFEKKMGIKLDNRGRIEPGNMRIMLTEAPLNPKDNRKPCSRCTLAEPLPEWWLTAVTV